MSWLFAVVQKLLQISKFSLAGHRVCSLLFSWVGVLLVYDRQRSIQPLSTRLPLPPTAVLAHEASEDEG